MNGISIKVLFKSPPPSHQAQVQAFQSLLSCESLGPDPVTWGSLTSSHSIPDSAGGWARSEGHRDLGLCLLCVRHSLHTLGPGGALPSQPSAESPELSPLTVRTVHIGLLSWPPPFQLGCPLSLCSLFPCLRNDPFSLNHQFFSATCRWHRTIENQWKTFQQEARGSDQI